MNEVRLIMFGSNRNLAMKFSLFGDMLTLKFCILLILKACMMTGYRGDLSAHELGSSICVELRILSIINEF